VIGKLQVADLVKAVLQVPAEIALADLHVVEIPVDLAVFGVHFAANAHGVGAAVKAMALVIDPDVHRLEDHRHVVLLADRHGAFERLDHVLVHLALRHAADIVAGHHGHQLAVQPLGRLTGVVDLLHERVVVLWIVHAGRKAPGGELGAGDTEILGEFCDLIQPLAMRLVRPELVGWKTQCGRGFDPFHKRQPREPHLDVDREFRVRRTANLGAVIDGG
jgi:hypothetical protein